MVSGASASRVAPASLRHGIARQRASPPRPAPPPWRWAAGKGVGYPRVGNGRGLSPRWRETVGRTLGAWEGSVPQAASRCLGVASAGWSLAANPPIPPSLVSSALTGGDFRGFLYRFRVTFRSEAGRRPQEHGERSPRQEESV